MYSNGGIYIPDRKPPMGAVMNPYLPINQGLVFNGLFDEGSGGQVRDLSGNNNTGTFQGASTWVVGKFGAAVESRNNADYIALGAPNILNLENGEYTIIAWIKMGETQTRAYPMFYCDGSFRFSFGLDNATNTKLARWQNNANERVANTVIPTGWNQIALVGQADTCYFFLNGVADGSGAGSTYTGHTDCAIGNITIGSQQFIGPIDHMLIYNRGLLVREIASLLREPFRGFRWTNIVQLASYIAVGGEDFFRTINDGVGIADVMGRIQVQTRTIDDGIGTVDAMGRTQVQLRTLAESLGITDALWKAETRIFADAVGITDAIIKSQGYARTIADNIGIVDSEFELITYVRTLAESLGITDVMSKTVGFPRTISDDVGITDSVTRTVAFARVVAEAMGISDVVTRTQVQLRTIADAMGLTDAMTPGQVITFAEAMGMTDAMTHTKTQIRTFAEAMGITDALTQIATYVFTQADDIGIGDAMIRVAVALRTVSDDIGMTDEVSGQIGELVKAAWAFMIIRQTHN